MARKLVFARSENLERSWPFVPEVISERLKSLGELEVVQVEPDISVSDIADLSEVEAIALLGGMCRTGARSESGRWSRG